MSCFKFHIEVYSSIILISDLIQED